MPVASDDRLRLAPAAFTTSARTRLGRCRTTLELRSGDAGAGPEIGEALTASPDVDMISFTGSSAVGRVIHERCGAQMKRTLLELGGKSACIVFADCDAEKALRGAMSPWTFHSGQICTAPTRLLVEESFYAEFTDRLATDEAIDRFLEEPPGRLTYDDMLEEPCAVGPRERYVEVYDDGCDCDGCACGCDGCACGCDGCA